MARTLRRARYFIVETTRPSSRSPQEVMEQVQDPSTWPEWQPEILSTEGPEILELREVVAGRAKMLGFRVQGQSITLNSTPAEFVEDVIVGVRMKVTYRVEGTAEGCTVTRRLEAELPGGISGRILGLFLRMRLRSMQDRVLDALAG